MKLNSKGGKEGFEKETEDSDIYADEKIHKSRDIKNYYHPPAPAYGPPLLPPLPPRPPAPALPPADPLW